MAYRDHSRPCGTSHGTRAVARASPGKRCSIQRDDDRARLERDQALARVVTQRRLAIEQLGVTIEESSPTARRREPPPSIGRSTSAPTSATVRPAARTEPVNELATPEVISLVAPRREARRGSARVDVGASPTPWAARGGPHPGGSPTSERVCPRGFARCITVVHGSSIDVAGASRGPALPATPGSPSMWLPSWSSSFSLTRRRQ